MFSASGPWAWRGNDIAIEQSMNSKLTSTFLTRQETKAHKAKIEGCGLVLPLDFLEAFLSFIFAHDVYSPIWH